MTPLLKYIDGARAVANPWGIVSQVDRLCRNLNNRARVILRPRWEYNYTYYPISYNLWRISELANAKDSRINTALTRLLSEAPYYFSLAFPPTTKPNILHMAIWGHELGHFIDNIEGMSSFDPKGSLDYQTTYMSQQHAKELTQRNLPPEIANKIKQNMRFTSEEKIAEALEKYNKPIVETVNNWARELFADLISIHLFGPAAIFALVEFVQPLLEGKTNQVYKAYPPFGVRLDLILQEYEKWISNRSIDKKVSGSRNQNALRILRTEIDRLKKAGETFRKLSLSDEDELDNEVEIIDVIQPYMIELLKVVVADFSKQIEALKRDNPDCYLKTEDLNLIGKGLNDLEQGMPPHLISDHLDPTVIGVKKRVLALVINSGWLYWLKIKQSLSDKKTGYSEYTSMQIEYERINQLLLRAVEANEAAQWFSEQGKFTETDPAEREILDHNIINETIKERKKSDNQFGILQKNEFYIKMSRGELIIQPLLSPSSQINPTSVDLRLGNEFLVMKRSALTKLDPREVQFNPSIIDGQNKYFVPFGKPFVLHPWQFISTTCLEFVKLPGDCIGWIANRKWLTKLGLVYVGSQDLTPGFKGQVILELTNLGNAPILLYPGSRICRIYLFPISQLGSITG